MQSVRRLVWALLLNLSLGISSVFAATTSITFDDLVADNWSAIPDGYGGVAVWEGAQYVNFDWLSPTAVITGSSISLGFAAPVAFLSVDMSVTAPGAIIELYRNDSLVFSQGEVPSDAFRHVSSGYAGLVDKIVFTTHGEGMNLDNIEYSTTAPVPEPETYAMMLAGLGLLGLAGRRKS